MNMDKNEHQDEEHGEDDSAYVLRADIDLVKVVFSNSTIQLHQQKIKYLLDTASTVVGVKKYDGF